MQISQVSNQNAVYQTNINARAQASKDSGQVNRRIPSNSVPLPRHTLQVAMPTATTTATSGGRPAEIERDPSHRRPRLQKLVTITSSVKVSLNWSESRMLYLPTEAFHHSAERRKVGILHQHHSSHDSSLGPTKRASTEPRKTSLKAFAFVRECRDLSERRNVSMKVRFTS